MKKKENLITAFVLVFIILTQLIYTTSVFNSKQTFHTDELWSYGLSNSYYRPFLFLDPKISLTNEEGQRWDNAGKWLDGEFFGDYLTVQEDQRFRYDSVWFNQSKDMHPPLYYSVLHTICSFFPEQFSWYFAFSISVVCLCVTQIFLFLLAYEITRKRTVSLMVCALYACSVAALFTFTFIRQYSMLTMWCTVIMWLFARIFSSDFNLKKYLAPLVIFLLLGAFTQQMILIYIGGITLFSCIYFLIKKRIRTMLVFGLSMTAAVVLYITVWPYALGAVSIYLDNHIYSYWVEVRIYINRILQNTFGFKSIFPVIYPRMPYFIAFMMAAVVAGAIVFVFRREKWCVVAMRAIRRFIAQVCRGFHKERILIPIIFAACFIHIMAAAKVSDVAGMGQYSLRYVSFCIPAVIVATMGIVYFAFRFISHREWIGFAATCIVAVVCVVTMNVSVNRDFISTPTETTKDQIRQMLENETVIMSLDTKPMIQSFPEMLMDSDKVYFDKFDNFFDYPDYIEELKNKEMFYVIISGTNVIWEKDIESMKENAFYVPEDSNKEMLKGLNVQFIDDYIGFFEGMDFVDDTQIMCRTSNNGFATLIIRVKTNKKV